MSRSPRAPLGVIVCLVAMLLLPTFAMADPASGHATSILTVPRGGALFRGSSVTSPPSRSDAPNSPTPSSPALALSGPSAANDPRLPPHPSLVNPLRYYSREPAPMGIADFGVTGTSPGASGYEYSSTSFEGKALVRSLSVSISGSSSKVTAFELNAVVVFERNGTNYSYWIQNGLHLDAGTDEFTIGGAYVWNFSAPGATLRAGELEGNAGSTLSSDTYYFIPGCGSTYPGQCSTVSLPANLTGRIVTAESGRVPYVAYEYDLGPGWVVYDNVSFPHMANASDPGFRVDGFAPTPYAASLYYDAEWVWVGAGGGSASTDQGSDINLTLSFWNDHNYQAIPTAWNFGTNTGETSTNVTELPTNPLGAHLASGPGTLGVLYNLSGVGFLNLSAPTRDNGTVLVDGQSIPFQHGSANLTLASGAHSLYLQNFTNASDQFEIRAGATTTVNLSAAGEVWVNESGLPTGTLWGIEVDGAADSTTGDTLSVNLANGTYPVEYEAVAGYEILGADPSTISLPGTSQITLTFAPFTYEVDISESGLPDSTPWWINVSGRQVEGTGDVLAVMAPNGSTPYEAGSLYEFLASPGQGTINVSAGTSSPLTIVFSYRPTFIEGTVTPEDANVAIGGVPQDIAGGRFNASVIPGPYVLVASAPGFETTHLTVVASPGNVSWQNITLQANRTTGPGSSGATPTGGGISVMTEVIILTAVAVLAAVAAVVVVRRPKQ